MKFKDLIEMGLKNLWRRKLRTFLTVLGVIIGTSSIVVMLSLGLGMSQAQKDQIESMGSLTTITISKGYGGGMMGMEQNNSSSKKVSLDKKAVDTLNKIPNVDAAMPIAEAYGTIVNGKFLSTIPIKGVVPEMMDKFDYKLEEGRLLQPGDDLAFVFGGGINDSFYNPNGSNGRQPEFNVMQDKMFFTFDDNYGQKPEPGQKKPKFKEYKVKAVGKLEQGSMDNDWAVFVPLKTLEKIRDENNKITNNKEAKKSKEYESILVKVNDAKNVKEVQEIIKDMGFEAFSLNEILDEVNKGSAIIQGVLGGIGAVSLLVAAIGITNTMVMSIYERTKEIGVMKVIGASIQDIKRLFLFESATIGLLGGLLGGLFSKLISMGLNSIAPNILPIDAASRISIIPIWLMAAAIGFSTLIGIASGYYPAKRAMNLSALEAIKTE